MKGSEWSLIIFTLLIQLAVGWVITFSVLQIKYFDLQSSVGKGIVSKLTLILIPIILVALFSSFLHLGSPIKAIYVFNNLTSSWLSLEILLVILFSVTVSFLIYAFNGSVSLFEHRNLICLLSSTIGLLLLFSMSKIYMIETVPAWNKLSTPILFTTSSLILGLLFLLVVLSWLVSGKEVDITFASVRIKYFKNIIMLVSMLLLLETVVFVVQNFIHGSNIAELESRRIILENNTLLFSLRILLNLVAIIGLLIIAQSTSYQRYYLSILTVSFFIISISEIIGRYLFYEMYSRLGV